MALALDRKAFIDILSGGKADISGVMLPPPEGVWGMPPEVMQTLPGYGADVEKSRAEARKIMEGLGYSEAKPLKVKVSTRNIAIYRDPAVILIDQLKKIHIDGELEVVDTSIWHAKVTRGDYSVGLNLTGVGVDDPDVNLYENYSCNSERNLHQVLQQGGRRADRQAVAGDRRRQAQEDRLGDRAASSPRTWPGRSSSTTARPPAGSRTSRASCCTRTASTTTGASRTSGSTSSAGAERAGDREESRVGAYLVRRLLLMLLTLFGMSILIFVMLRLVPGNITDIIFDSAGFVNPAQKKKIERELGLDQPIVIQYVTWIGGLVRGDLGYAYVSEKPAHRRDPAAHSRHRQARRAGAGLLRAVRRAARRDQRGAPEHARSTTCCA